MGNETAGDWLRNKGLSTTDIDFIETLLTFTSTAKELNNKLDEINKTLRDNGIGIDLIEMLTRYKEQGLCAGICNQLLESQLYR